MANEMESMLGSWSADSSPSLHLDNSPSERTFLVQSRGWGGARLGYRVPPAQLNVGGRLRLRGGGGGDLGVATGAIGGGEGGPEGAILWRRLKWKDCQTVRHKLEQTECVLPHRV